MRICLFLLMCALLLGASFSNPPSSKKRDGNPAFSPNTAKEDQSHLTLNRLLSKCKQKKSRDGTCEEYQFEFLCTYYCWCCNATEIGQRPGGGY